MTSFPLLAPHKWRPLGAAWTIALLSSLAVLFVGEVIHEPGELAVHPFSLLLLAIVHQLHVLGQHERLV